MRKMIPHSSITFITSNATFDEACNLPLQCTPSRPPKKSKLSPGPKNGKEETFPAGFFGGKTERVLNIYFPQD